jgi:hypothetical protein
MFYANISLEPRDRPSGLEGDQVCCDVSRYSLVCVEETGGFEGTPHRTILVGADLKQQRGSVTDV